jgi:hypothetical protein
MFILWNSIIKKFHQREYEFNIISFISNFLISIEKFFLNYRPIKTLNAAKINLLQYYNTTI